MTAASVPFLVTGCGSSEYSNYPETEWFVVYSVESDANGYPRFLIYHNNQWAWKSAKYFRPAPIVSCSYVSR